MITSKPDHYTNQNPNCIPNPNPNSNREPNPNSNRIPNPNRKKFVLADTNMERLALGFELWLIMTVRVRDGVRVRVLG